MFVGELRTLDEIALMSSAVRIRIVHIRHAEIENRPAAVEGNHISTIQIFV